MKNIELRKLPEIEPHITELKIGVVRPALDGRMQVYFGGNGIEHVSFYDHVELRKGAVQVDMYTIDGNPLVDYAVVSVLSPLAMMDRHERNLLFSRKIRGLGSGLKPFMRVGQTPTQQFVCGRGFIDMPISGKARYIALDPFGEVIYGKFDGNHQSGAQQAAWFGEGWTFIWVAEGSEPFVFGELCSPRFIDDSGSVPVGELGIVEIDDIDHSTLPGAFKEAALHFLSGE